MFDGAPNSDEWWVNLNKRLADIREKLNKLSKDLEESRERLRGVVARITLNELRRHPERRQAFIEKLYDPFYELTPVDEIVIQRLLEEDHEEDFRE